jgi:vancomycin resistance protein YoaR
MSRLLVVLVILELTLLLAVGWLLGPGLDQRILPGVWVWDVSLDGLTPGEAVARLRTSLSLTEPGIVVVGPEGQRWSFSPADLGIAVDAQATVSLAYGPGHTAQGLDAVPERVSVLVDGVRISPVLVWDAARAQASLERVAAELDRPAQDAVVQRQGASVELVAGDIGQQVDISSLLGKLLPSLYALQPTEVVVPVRQLQPAISDDQAARAISIAERILSSPLVLLVPTPLEGDPGPWTVSPDVVAGMLSIQVQGDSVRVEMDEAALAQFLAPLAMALYRAPVDAEFAFNTEPIQLKLVNPSVVGREVDVAASVGQIADMLQAGTHMVPLVITEILPEVRDDLTAEDLGLRELVAVGESYFTGSSTARDRNIRLGASKFSGVVVAPGEVFSFNEHLGDVTPEAGYDESYVIIGNETVLGVGGGICQVATTAFRAAYFAGYPIVERWPHAYRVGYYELGGFGPGFDATIYSPVVDFRFENDTPYHILIQTEVDTADSRLRFLFFSTKDGRTVEQVGPEWGESIPPGQPVYQYDESLPAGTVKQVETAHNGLNAVLGRVVRDSQGNALYQDEFVSKFVPWPARFAFGPGYTPPAEAEVVGTPEP